MRGYQVLILETGVRIPVGAIIAAVGIGNGECVSWRIAVAVVRTPKARLPLSLRVGVFALPLYAAGCSAVKMPGKSHVGPLPPLTPAQAELRDALRRDVEILAEQIGERNLLHPPRLRAAAEHIEKSLAKAGLKPKRHPYSIGDEDCWNIEAEIAGTARPEEIVLIGAHYDSVVDCPGANDNATGVAGLLALGRAMAGRKPDRTLRLVAFTNEEPPFFKSPKMGSLVYARACRARGDKIVAMIALETMGCYRDEAQSQKYPFPLNLVYPSTGDFIAFVGNRSSKSLVHAVVASFRRHASFPSQGAAVPDFVEEAGWSDHWSFWQAGYPGLMVTDTAPFRYAHYHTAQDKPAQLDYERLARVMDGLTHVIDDLLSVPVGAIAPAGGNPAAGDAAKGGAVDSTVDGG